MTAEERDIVREPLDRNELRDLGRRAGGVRELVGPRRRTEVEQMSEDEVLDYLTANPKRLRRPIIDTGTALHLGFSRSVREALEGSG